MPRRILLLTGPREVPFFHDFIRARDPEIRIASAETLDGLLSEVDQSGGHIRLLAFCTGIIVPAAVLGRLTLTPYNIHPGPPDYPGNFPEVFALVDGARHFGATAHEMVAKVDAGPIVHVERFPIPERARRLDLGDLAYAAAVQCFAHVAARCAVSDAPLPVLPVTWGPRKTTRRDFAALQARARVSVGTEGERLRRACGPDEEPDQKKDAAALTG